MNNKKNPIIEEITFFNVLIICSVIFYFTRADALDIKNSFWGYNSDTSIYSLMAEEIIRGERLPIFFYGQNYMGPLTSIFICIVQVAFNFFHIYQFIPGTNEIYIISPIATNYACFFMVWLGGFFNAIAVKRIFNLTSSLLFMFIFFSGNRVLVEHSLRPNGVEMVIILQGVLLYISHLYYGNKSLIMQTIIGFILGISLWMNQTLLFMIFPIIYFFVCSTNWFGKIRSMINLKDRYWLNHKGLNISAIHPVLRQTIILFHHILILNLVVGIIISFYGGVDTKLFGVIKFKINNGFSPIKTSILVFFLIQFLIWFFKGNDSKKKTLDFILSIRYAILGFIIAYFPVLVGSLFGWYEKSYSFEFKFIPSKLFIPHIYELFSDYYFKLFYLVKFDYIGYLTTLFTIIIIIFTVKKYRKDIKDYLSFMPRTYSFESILWGVFFFNFLYTIFSYRLFEHDYVYRYGVVMIPSFYIFLSVSIIRLRKLMKIFAILTFVLVSYSSFLQGKSHMSYFIKKDGTLKNVRNVIKSQYKVCYADFYIAYKYEFLTQHKVKFIPPKSHDRTPKWTKERESMPVKKCYINSQFKIKEYK